MSLTQFQHASIATFTFSRGMAYPLSQPQRPRQRISRSDSGRFQVVTLSAVDEQWTLVFPDLPVADLVSLLAWANNTNINWAEGTFTYVDEDSVSYTVRLLNLEWQEIGPDVFSVSITLVREPGT